jgi:hypothetical protein
LKSRSIILILLIAAAAVCTKRPTEPQILNPFDPRNAVFKGDPLAATAEIAGGGITVRWNPVQSPTVQGYRVYRSKDSTGSPSLIRIVSQDAEIRDRIVDVNIVNGHSYYYSVTAWGDAFGESTPSLARSVHLPVIPVLRISTENGWTNSRTADLTILAVPAVDMCLSNQADFTSSVWEPCKNTKKWLLSDGDGLKTVFMKVRDAAGVESIAVSDSVTLDTVKPVFLCSAEPDSGSSGTYFTFSVDAVRDNATDSTQMMFRFSSAEWGEGEWTAWHRFDYPIRDGHGLIDVLVQARDLAGNTVDSTLTVYVNTPPEAGFTYQRKGPDIFDFFLMPAGRDAEDPASDCSYRWDFDGDGGFDTAWMAADTVSHDFGGPGGFRVILEMMDTGHYTDIAEKTILVPTEGMVFVPAGDFATGCGSDEGRTVFVEDFWIDRYEVTVPEFVDFVNDMRAQGRTSVDGNNYLCVDWSPVYDLGSHNEIRPAGNGYIGTLERIPIRYANVWGAVKYAKYRGKRIPTAVEWEKAARKDTRTYPWGNEPPNPGLCNYTLFRPVRVGSYSPQGDSPYGCSDMAGNVMELVWIMGFLVRGGDFRSQVDAEMLLKSCNPNWNTPGDFPQGYGFRCVIGPVMDQQP